MTHATDKTTEVVAPATAERPLTRVQKLIMNMIRVFKWAEGKVDQAIDFLSSDHWWRKAEGLSGKAPIVRDSNWLSLGFSFPPSEELAKKIRLRWVALALLRDILVLPFLLIALLLKACFACFHLSEKLAQDYLTLEENLKALRALEEKLQNHGVHSLTPDEKMSLLDLKNKVKNINIMNFLLVMYGTPIAMAAVIFVDFMKIAGRFLWRMIVKPLFGRSLEAESRAELQATALEALNYANEELAGLEARLLKLELAFSNHRSPVRNASLLRAKGALVLAEIKAGYALSLAKLAMEEGKSCSEILEAAQRARIAADYVSKWASVVRLESEGQYEAAALAYMELSSLYKTGLHATTVRGLARSATETVFNEMSGGAIELRDVVTVAPAAATVAGGAPLSAVPALEHAAAAAAP